jgi:type III secretion protein C
MVKRYAILRLLTAALLCLPLGAEEPSKGAAESHSINFNDVPVTEFIRFVSKISRVNFIYDHKELQFNVTLASGKAVTAENVLKALIQMLRVNGFAVMTEQDYYVIHRCGADKKGDCQGEAVAWLSSDVDGGEGLPARAAPADQHQFFVYKLKYHQGSEIQEAIKKVAGDLKGQARAPQKLAQAIEAIQWVKSTNSLLCSGDTEALSLLRNLLDSLDIPLRQVFIEVLVIETDVRKSLDFGLQWAAGGEYMGRIGAGMGNFPPGLNAAPFASTLQGVNAAHPPTGLNQIPVGSGFDFGVIGDIIMHKGKSYLSLGSLVSALQADGDSTIVLNQKIITQDNKNSKIFVGDNVPFTGSVVQTVGQGQQTTSNIEYRDIGVSLSITPMLGEGDIITLELAEEITESLSDLNFPNNTAAVNGIRTTKTNMATNVHVPDKHFLVVSGMIRNAKQHHRAGLPCLGGLPVIGAAFSKTKKRDEKRNMIIFVRPHIIRSFEDYKNVTASQEELYKEQSNAADFQDGLDLIRGP